MLERSSIQDGDANSAPHGVKERSNGGVDRKVADKAEPAEDGTGANGGGASGVIAPKDAASSLKFGMSAILGHVDGVKRSPQAADAGEC